MPLPRVLKWISIGLGGLLGLLVVAAFIFALVGHDRLNGTDELSPALAHLQADSAVIARGEHVARIHGCQGCHGETLGGDVVADMPLGRFVASNLTSGHGGIASSYRDEDWDHAIRFGVRPDHRAIVPVMPFRLYNHLSDADAAALIVYLKQLAPIDNALPPTTVRLPGYIVVGIGGMQQLFGHLSQPPRTSPPPGTTAYGAYLASTICADCHGEGLLGGKHPAPDAPPGPSLVAAAYWSQPQFATAVRTGIAPGNRKLSGWMPSPQLKHLTDEETRSLYEYIQTLRPSTARRQARRSQGSSRGRCMTRQSDRRRIT